MRFAILSAKDVQSLIEYFKQGGGVRQFRRFPDVEAPFVFLKLNRQDESSLKMGDERFFVHVIMCNKQDAIRVTALALSRYVMFVYEGEVGGGGDAMEEEEEVNETPISERDQALLVKMQELDSVDIYQQMSTVMLRELKDEQDASSVMGEFIEDLYADLLLRELIENSALGDENEEVQLEPELDPSRILDGLTLPGELDSDMIEGAEGVIEPEKTSEEDLLVLIAARTDPYTNYVRLMCGTAGQDIRAAFVKLPDTAVIQEEGWESFGKYLDSSFYAALTLTQNYLYELTKGRLNLNQVLWGDDLIGFTLCAEHSGKVFNQAKSSNPFRNTRTRYTLIEAQADLNLVMKRMRNHFVGKRQGKQQQPSYLKITHQPWRQIL